jgi:phage baseplate assembly protein W
MARADFYTVSNKSQEYFSDFLVNLDKSPLSNDVGLVTNEDSVKQSIRALVLTNLGESLFQPNKGSIVYRSLFEPFGPFAASSIKTAIEQTVKFNEPRVALQSVNVIPSEDQNSYTVNIYFSMINNPNPISLDLILQRVR